MSFDAPHYYYDIPELERATRTYLTSDLCVVDNEHFFVRLCLEVPILQPGGARPLLELEDSEHPLCVDFRQGITLDRARILHERSVHAV